MTLAESTLVRDLREAFRVKLEAEYGALRKRYTMLSGLRIAAEIGLVAMQWGWALADQAVEGRIRQAKGEGKR